MMGQNEDLGHLLTLIQDKKAEKGALQEIAQDIRWQAVLELAWHHRVYPVLYDKLYRIDTTTSASLSSDTLGKLATAYRSNMYTMLAMEAECERLFERFSAARVRLICLKGPVLGQELYGDVGLRTSSDLDLLVSRRQLQDGEQLLLSAGYVKQPYFERVLGDWTWRHHHFTYIHPQTNVKVELHWRLGPGPAHEPAFSELWSSRQKSTIGQQPIFYLGTEHLFLFLALHGARHGWSRLRWLLDMRQLLEQGLAWRRLHRLAIRYGAGAIIVQVLLLLEQLLDYRIDNDHPVHMLDLWEEKDLERGRRLAHTAMFYIENKVELHAAKRSAKLDRYHRRYLYDLQPLPQRTLAMLGNWLYPYPEDAATLPLPRMLHPLYFPLRPALVIWRRLTPALRSEKQADVGRASQVNNRSKRSAAAATSIVRGKSG